MNDPTEQDINDVAESYYAKGYDRGLRAGYKDGYKKGHYDGYKKGYEATEQTAFECIAKENANDSNHNNDSS